MIPDPLQLPGVQEEGPAAIAFIHVYFLVEIEFVTIHLQLALRARKPRAIFIVGTGIIQRGLEGGAKSLILMVELLELEPVEPQPLAAFDADMGLHPAKILLDHL